jgi:hypothetical protein
MRAASNAYMIVNGQLDTELINAKQYAFRNVPFVPALQTIMAAPIDLLRALQQSTGGQPSSGRVVPLQPQSGADQVGTSGEELKTGDGRPEAAGTDSSTAPETAAPLADPPENR